MNISAAVALALVAAQTQTVVVPASPAPDQPDQTQPTSVPEDSPEEIAEDAARDLKDSRFYNKPGATRAQYEAAWQECRLIARGSRTPSGSYAYTYNPAVISPVAAGIAGGIGAGIGAAIAEGMLRRANRRSCLMVRGWRLVEVDDATRAKVAAMDDAARNSWFDSIVGVAELPGMGVTSWTNHYAAPQLAPETAQ